VRTKEDILDLELDELLTLWNDYCDDVHYWDDQIYYNDEDFLSGFTPLDIAQKVSYGSYDYTDEFITFDGMGNFHTLNYFEEIVNHIDIDALIDWLNEKEEE
jgi:hypothetical protein